MRRGMTTKMDFEKERTGYKQPVLFFYENRRSVRKVWLVSERKIQKRLNFRLNFGIRQMKTDANG